MNIDKINEIVEKAFGKKYRGDYDDEYISIFDGPDGLKQIGKLCLIGKRTFGGFWCICAGQLGCKHSPESDGSVIVSFKKEPAEKYAELYEKAFGKKVRIILKDYLNPSEDFGFIPATAPLVEKPIISPLEKTIQEVRRPIEIINPWDVKIDQLENRIYRESSARGA